MSNLFINQKKPSVVTALPKKSDLTLDHLTLETPTSWDVAASNNNDDHLPMININCENPKMMVSPN